ncbi:DUF4832 domain-containing protein [Paraglaciecola marina]|uniref:DUF4832 domain-containing protein n=1 Tax=Paraglaciecola marina TaxID=2500157 RepID=UPI00105C031C|nr:DUF4832 domain-containing protein [Paraglaciecola marina]
MIILQNILIFSLLIAALSSCSGSTGSGQEVGGNETPTIPSVSEPETAPEAELLGGFTVTNKYYIKSDEDIANPSRGFYQHTETQTSAFIPLNKDDLVANRNGYQAADASYSVNATIILRAFILDNYVDNATLSSQTLSQTQTDFDTAREAGIKMVVRFYYHKNASEPYGDPDKATILAHIEQLQPILTENADVILTIQQGFIGAWGEQYYTDNFSPAGDVSASYTDQNWLDRSEVLAALLTATAESTMVQVRTPQAKQKLIYGADAPITAGLSGTEGSLTADGAFSGGDIARIGFHNDCFLTDDSDTGTYADYGTAGGEKQGNAVGILKSYHQNDSQFVIVGGETCKDEDWAIPPVSYANDCSDDVVNTMDELNYSYLNTDYNNSVNNDWTEGDDACMDEIKNRLGYRLAMTSSTAVATANAGNYVPFLLTVDNDGFTSVITAMELRLILKHQITGLETTIVLEATGNDIRTWQSGTTEIGEYIKLPDNLAIGSYDLFLHIADVSNHGVIATRPEYSIQLANVGLWDELNGYNNLEQTMTVSAYVEGEDKNTRPTEPLIELESEPSIQPVVVNISIDGNANDWDSISLLASAENQQVTSLKVIADETYLYIAMEGNEMGPYFDLFINSDGDNSTGFQSSDWALSGADYLIQQGTGDIVTLYKSTGSDWSWEPQNTHSIEANSSTNFIELSIEQSDIDPINSSINIGVNDVDVMWQVQSRLPLADEVMSAYSLPLTD